MGSRVELSRVGLGRVPRPPYQKSSSESSFLTLPLTATNGLELSHCFVSECAHPPTQRPYQDCLLSTALAKRRYANACRVPTAAAPSDAGHDLTGLPRSQSSHGAAPAVHHSSEKHMAYAALITLLNRLPIGLGSTQLNANNYLRTRGLCALKIDSAEKIRVPCHPLYVLDLSTFIIVE